MAAIYVVQTAGLLSGRLREPGEIILPEECASGMLPRFVQRGTVIVLPEALLALPELRAAVKARREEWAKEKAEAVARDKAAVEAREAAAKPAPKPSKPAPAK